MTKPPPPVLEPAALSFEEMVELLTSAERKLGPAKLWPIAGWPSIFDDDDCKTQTDEGPQQ